MTRKAYPSGGSSPQGSGPASRECGDRSPGGFALYLPDGSELIFQPNTSIQLEVSAPGYLTKVIQYDIKKRQ